MNVFQINCKILIDITHKLDLQQKSKSKCVLSKEVEISGRMSTVISWFSCCYAVLWLQKRVHGQLISDKMEKASTRWKKAEISCSWPSKQGLQAEVKLFVKSHGKRGA